MVHNQAEKQCLAKQLSWKLNIPFASVPEGFIRAHKKKPFSYEEYLSQADMMDRSETYWNISLWDESQGQILLFSWGIFDPLEKQLYVARVSKHPELLSYRGEYLDKFAEVLKAFAQQLGMQCVFWITDRPKVWLKKLDGIARVNDKATILELY